MCPHCGDPIQRAPNGQVARTAAAIVLGLAVATVPALTAGCSGADFDGTGGSGVGGSSLDNSVASTYGSAPTTTTGGWVTSSSTGSTGSGTTGSSASSSGSAGNSVPSSEID